MKIREKCKKCNNYYGQNLFDFAKNKSAHLKKCGFKIKNCEEKFKNHQVQECKGSRKWWVNTQTLDFKML